MVLWRIWARGPIRTKSDFARYHADHIAIASSEHWITTEVWPGVKEYGRAWMLTPEGLLQFHAHASINKEFFHTHAPDIQGTATQQEDTDSTG